MMRLDDTNPEWERPQVTVLHAEELDRDYLRVLASGSDDPLKSSGPGKADDGEENY